MVLFDIMEESMTAKEKGRRLPSYLRLSPPRAGDRKHISIYEAIGISEDDLNRDRNERHMGKTEKLTASCQRIDLDEKAEVIDKDTRDLDHRWDMPCTEEDNLDRVHQSVGFDGVGVDYAVTENDKHNQSRQHMKAEVWRMAIRGDNRTQNELHIRKTNILTAHSQSSRLNQEMEGSVIRDSNLTGELSRGIGAVGNQPPEDRYGDLRLRCLLDGLGPPMDL
jgi:hypothetical protein